METRPEEMTREELIVRVRLLEKLCIEQIALAQYADQDFGEEVGRLFLAEPAERTAWHRRYAAELLEERLAALAGGVAPQPAQGAQDGPGGAEEGLERL